MNNKKIFNWAAPALFVVTLLINYLSTTGIILPNTQETISNSYVNLLAPPGFTFSIWGVIYLGVILSLTLSFRTSENDALGENYRQKVVPLFLEWMIFNIIWIITWSYELILVALIAIVLYTRTLWKLTFTISDTPVLKNEKWRLTYPVGLHTGWLTTASFANLTIWMVSLGFDGTGNIAVVWTIAALVIILALVAYLYRRSGNHAVMLPALWALIGITTKHLPNSSFEYASPTVMYASIALFVIGLIIYIYLFRQHSKKQSAK